MILVLHVIYTENLLLIDNKLDMVLKKANSPEMENMPQHFLFLEKRKPVLKEKMR